LFRSLDDHDQISIAVLLDGFAHLEAALLGTPLEGTEVVGCDEAVHQTDIHSKNVSYDS
jgi:hypothetical protein